MNTQLDFDIPESNLIEDDYETIQNFKRYNRKRIRLDFDPEIEEYLYED